MILTPFNIHLLFLFITGYFNATITSCGVMYIWVCALFIPQTVVLVVDRGEGFNTKGIRTNIMNLNLGKNVDDALPNMFWMRLINKLGNQPYVKEVGEDTAIMNVVQAVTYCLEDKENICKDLPFNL